MLLLVYITFFWYPSASWKSQQSSPWSWALHWNYTVVTCIWLFCAHVYKQWNGVPNKAILQSILRVLCEITWKLRKSNGLVHCLVFNLLLFHAKIVMTESHKFWTSLSEEEGKHFSHLVTFWFGIFTMSFHATRSPVSHENTLIKYISTLSYRLISLAFIFLKFSDFLRILHVCITLSIESTATLIRHYAHIKFCTSLARQHLPCYRMSISMVWRD